MPGIQSLDQPGEQFASARRVEARPARHDIHPHQVGEQGIDVEIVEHGQLQGLAPAHQVELVLLLHEVRLLVHRRDHGIHIGELAAESEIGGRAPLELFDHLAPAYDGLLDDTSRRTGRHGGRDVAQVAVEGRPFAQEAALGRFANRIVGSEQGTFEALRRIDLERLLTLRIGIRPDDAGHGLGHPHGIPELLLELFAREESQRIAGRASGTQGGQVLAVVVAVEQPHLPGIARRDAVDHLIDDGPGIEPLGVGIKGILPQSGNQTIIIGRKHRYLSALNNIRDTFSRR